MRGLGSVWEFEGSSPTPILPGQHKAEGQTKIFLYPRTYITVSPPLLSPSLSLRVLVHFLLSRWYHTQTGLPWLCVHCPLETFYARGGRA